ncbi:MAG: DegV family protein [Actinobacteria bacterium]|nr:DegV family protein [Actinomycetota bacterium]
MIRIITDSGCDLAEALLDRHRIHIVGLTVRFGDTDYLDRTDLTIDEFWEKLLGGDVTPQTAAPSVGQFTDAYERLQAEGADGIVVLCMSSAISATHQSATLAAEAWDGIPVRVIDSRLVSGALGLAVLEAAEAAEAGGDIDGVAEVAGAACAATSLYATLDTLEFLKRGGRIGTAAAFVGGLLDVKPIISFEGGAVTAAGRVRTRKRAVDDVLDHLKGLEGTVARLGVIHSEAADLDGFLADVAAVHGSEPLVMRIGPIVGTHAGPGALGVVYRMA